MINEILYLILFTSSTVLAARVVVSKGMLLESVGNWAEDKVEQGHKIYDLIICPFCMNTVFIFFGWALMFLIRVVPFEFDVRYIGVHIVSWFTCSFLSGIIWTAYLTLSARKEYYEEIGEYYKGLNKVFNENNSDQ